jgi:hypothetical protein
MNSNRPIRLDDLPMFASDRQIAEAIVGKDKAEKWLKERLPTLASKPGFPPIDPVHEGRAVALVKLFYANYLHLPADGRGVPDNREQEGQWKSSRRQA